MSDEMTEKEYKELLNIIGAGTRGYEVKKFKSSFYSIIEKFNKLVIGSSIMSFYEVPGNPLASEFHFDPFYPGKDKDGKVDELFGYTIFKWRTIDFLVKYDCPRCKAEHEMIHKSKEKYLQTPHQTDIHNWFSYKKRISCSNCGKSLKPSIRYYIKGGEPVLPVHQVLINLEDWNKSRNGNNLLPLFSLKDKTIRIKGKKLILNWSRFLSDSVNGLETCPEELFQAVIINSTKRELIKMLKGKKNIRVFGGMDFSKEFELKLKE